MLSAPVPAFTQEFRSGRPSSAEAAAGKQGDPPAGEAVLLHGFVKKSKRIPKKEMFLALQKLRGLD